MADWSQSHFLQSLGWATLNSFWQMALLWALFLGANAFFSLSSARKYQFSVLAVLAGFAWFVGSFLYYYSSDTTSVMGFLVRNIDPSHHLLQVFLTSASIAYLALLSIPAWRLFRNWQFVNRIKTEGLKKADLDCRLFVQKVAGQIGIRKKVQVFVSSIVRSPLTVGFVKPIVLLPMAAMNHLSMQQVEAVLLHELSHIRRADYLVNLVITVIHTMMYFNPFVKLFLKNIEAERENCCDELVLQFGYDKVGYASALLTLEKVSSQPQALVLAATGKQYLLSRIEKIIGMEKKNKRTRLNHVAGLLAALFCVVAFNSILIIREEKSAKNIIDQDAITNPFAIFRPGNEKQREHTISPVQFTPATENMAGRKSSTENMTLEQVVEMVNGDATLVSVRAEESPFMLVALNEIEVALTNEQKEQVKTAVKATRKVLSAQWNKVEESMADAMTAPEKELARIQYQEQLEKINWNNMEQNMKAGYQSIDWAQVNNNLHKALTEIQLDSLQRNYTKVLSELDKASCELAKAKVALSPIPDGSVEDIRKAKEQVCKELENIKAKQKKVIRL